MEYKYNKNMIENAKFLRKNMTKEEKHLWYDFLKSLPITVNRQKNIGRYIVDFFVASKNLVIELDGLQHETEENKAADAKRDAYLRDLGITVLRFKNKHIRQNFNDVCGEILKFLDLKFDDLR